MTTKPSSDIRSICLDARRILDAAREDLSNDEFKRRITATELDELAANVTSLEAGEGLRSTTLHTKVSAGVHAAKARAAILHLLADVRDDAKILFRDNEGMRHLFGVGAMISGASTREVRHIADTLLAAAASHPDEAAKVGLDANGVHALEDMVHALDGADLAHVHATTARHGNTVHVDSLAHAVSSEVAHLRLIARRVFRRDETRLGRYARTLPRHAVTPRAPVAPQATG
jgi:hypothetical protein